MYVVLGVKGGVLNGHITKGAVSTKGNPTIFGNVTRAEEARLEAHHKLDEQSKKEWELDIILVTSYKTIGHEKTH